MECPICSQPVTNVRGLASHFRHQSATHPDYKQWREDQRWVGKVEGEDYVRCLECGHRAATLARHLKAAHGITADQYREKHGEGVLIRPTKVTAKRKAAIKEGRKSEAYKGTKPVQCPCGAAVEIPKLACANLQYLCPACEKATLDAFYKDKSEPEDYVTCLECEYRAENLTSHIQNAHPDYRTKHPDAILVALTSAVRDKSALQGRTLSDETKQRMSENAGRWNAGLTKETDERVARYSEKLQGRVPWNEGLNADLHPSIERTAEKLRMYTGDDRPWDNGLAANLTLGDFRPFMDEEGKVDAHKVEEATGLSWVTVRKYMEDLGLALTRKYIERRAEAQTIRLEKETLERFQLGNGKVAIGRAMAGLNHDFKVIKRECGRHGLPTFNRRIRQGICLGAVSKALGDLPYKEEWESMRFLNPPTGRRFRYDGYFPDIGLVVEFQGYQHFTFPNVFMPDESYLPEYEAMRERDRIKRELIEGADDLTFFEVTEEEPYADSLYLAGRLVEAGVLRIETLVNDERVMVSLADGFRIESDGTVAGTTIFTSDGKQLGLVKSLRLRIDADEVVPEIEITQKALAAGDLSWGQVIERR